MPAPLRLGLIGFGRWGRVYAKTLAGLRSRCRLTQVATSDPSKLAGLARVAHAAEWQALLRGACDAVIVASPPDTHARIVAACVRAGVPCLVEKPLTMDVAQAAQLHAQVTRSRVPVLVNHIHLFDPAYEALTRELARRRERVRLIVSDGAAWGPFRTHTPALWDWAPHDISLCLDLIGSRPTQVRALGGPADPQGVPEQVSLSLAFRGGARAWVHAGRLAPLKRRVLGVATDRRLYVLDQLAADRLTVAETGYRGRYRIASAAAPAPRAIRIRSKEAPLARAVRCFIDGVRGGDRSRFGTALALDVVTVLAEAERRMRAR